MWNHVHRNVAFILKSVLPRSDRNAQYIQEPENNVGAPLTEVFLVEAGLAAVETLRGTTLGTLEAWLY